MTTPTVPESARTDGIDRLLREAKPEISQYRIDHVTRSVLSSIPEYPQALPAGWPLPVIPPSLLYGGMFLLGCLAPVLGHVFEGTSPMDWAFASIWPSTF